MAVTPADIAVELGRTVPGSTSPEYAQWELWIADALMLIAARLGNPAELDQARLNYVIRQAVSAHVKRPDDATQVAVSVDDGSVSRTFRSARGRVEIIDDWWTLLAPPNSSARAFSISPSVSTPTHLDWCSSSFGATYCSCGADIAGYPIYELDGDHY